MTTSTNTSSSASPAPRESWMLREIREQPAVLATTLAAAQAPAERIAQACADRQVDLILIVGRGTSDHAALYGQYLIQYLNSIPVALATPSLSTVYGGRLQLRRSLVVGISQSGQSPDVVRVLTDARAAGALTVAVSNVPSSPLALAADILLECRAGEERSVAATKTYTATCAALAAIATALPGGAALGPGLHALPDLVEAAIAAEHAVATVAPRYTFARGCVVLGRGFQYSTAREAALKLQETCYVNAMPFSTADFRHGPAALVEQGLPILMFAPPGRTATESLELLSILRERGADCAVASEDRQLLAAATVPIPLTLPPALMPATRERVEDRASDDTPPPAMRAAESLAVSSHELLAPIAYCVIGQLLAAHLAEAKGLDPDHPRGLSKVTHTF